MPRRYRVDIGPRAEQDAERAFRWLLKEAPLYALDWYDQLLEAIDTLEQRPERCARAPEAAVFGRDIRQLLYGKRPSLYRILFIVRDDLVHILRIRHGAQRRLALEDLLGT